jgi:hypothetical protein
MSKVYTGLLVGVALIGMAAIGTLALVVVTDVGYLADQALKPGMSPKRGAAKAKKPRHLRRGLRSARGGRLLFERGRNAAERGVQVRPECLYDSNDCNRDTSRDEAVFDGSGALLVTHETRNKLAHWMLPSLMDFPSRNDFTRKICRFF